VWRDSDGAADSVHGWRPGCRFPAYGLGCGPRERSSNAWLSWKCADRGSVTENFVGPGLGSRDAQDELTPRRCLFQMRKSCGCAVQRKGIIDVDLDCAVLNESG
jgi:hypothetical protein